MAIVTQPLASAEARGSVGGLTYNTWRGKHTVKTRTGPSREPTEDQLYILALGKAASNAWSLLSDDQRAAWNHYGNENPLPHWTGQTKRLSGHSWYVKTWVRSTLVGETPVDDPPALPNNDLLTDFVATPGASSCYVTWTTTIDEQIMGHYIECWLTKPLSAGRSPTIHDADRKGYATDLDSAFDFTSLAAGTYTAFFRPCNAVGLIGPWQSIKFTIT